MKRSCSTVWAGKYGGGSKEVLGKKEVQVSQNVLLLPSVKQVLS